MRLAAVDRIAVFPFAIYFPSRMGVRCGVGQDDHPLIGWDQINQQPGHDFGHSMVGPDGTGEEPIKVGPVALNERQDKSQNAGESAFAFLNQGSTKQVAHALESWASENAGKVLGKIRNQSGPLHVGFLCQALVEVQHHLSMEPTLFNSTPTKNGKSRA